MKKCLSHLLSGLAGAVLLAGTGYVAYQAHFKDFITSYHERLIEGGAQLELWRLVNEGDEIAAKTMVERGASSGWVGYSLADSILMKEEISKHMTSKGAVEGFDKLDFSKRDALLMSTMEGKIPNIELRMLLQSNSVRARYNAAEYERTFKSLDEQKASDNIIRQTKVNLKSNLTDEQKQRLESCYDKLEGYKHTTWNFLFHYDDTGACATPVEKVLEVVDAKQ